MPRSSAPRPPSDDYQPPDPTEEQQGLEEFLNLPGGQRVSIRRIHPTGRREQCEYVMLEEFIDDPAKYLRDTWGPGIYELGLQGPKGMYIKHRRLAVAARADKPEPVQVAAAPPPSSGGADIVALLMQQNAQMHQLVLGLIAGQARQPAGDPASMLTAMITAFQEVRKSASSEDPFERVRQVAGLVREMSGGASVAGEGPEHDEWGWVSEIGKRVVAALPGPKPAGPTTPAAESRSAQSEEDMFYQDLRDGVEMLAARSAAGIDPKVCAELVRKDAEFSNPASAVLAAIHQGGTVEQLKTFAPGLMTADFEKWAREFYAAINGAGPGADRSPGADSGGARGDVANAPGNEGSGS